MTIHIVNLVLIILLGNLLCLKGKAGKKVFMVFVAIQLTLLCGLRAETVGTDTHGYVRLYFDAFERVPLNLEFFRASSIESGYRLLGWLTRYISSEYFFYLTVVAAVPIILTCKTVYKYSADTVLSITAFVALRSYAFLFSGMRQGVALGICFYAYRYIVEKRLLPFLACVMLAMTFHRSAIAFIPAYFLTRVRLDIRGAVILALSGVLVVVLRVPLVYALISWFFEPTGYYAGYASRAFTGVGDAIMRGGLSITLVHLILLVSGMIRRRKLLETDENANAMLVFGYFAVLFYLLAFMGSIFYRIAMYYAWFSIMLLLPLLVGSFKEGRERLIFKYAAYIILCAQFIYFGPGGDTIPYEFFWQ